VVYDRQPRNKKIIGNENTFITAVDVDVDVDAEADH